MGMEEVVKNPERLGKSSYTYANDPNKVDTQLKKAMQIEAEKMKAEALRMDRSKSSGEIQRQPKEPQTEETKSVVTPRVNIKTSLEAARQRRLNLGKRSSLVIENDQSKKENDNGDAKESFLSIEG